MASYDPNKVKMTIGGIEIAGCESFETTDVVSGIDGEVKLSKKEECNHGVGLINGQCMLCTLEERIEEYAKEERQGLLFDSLHNWSECTLSDVIDDLSRYADAEKEEGDLVIKNGEFQLCDDGPTVKQLLNVTYPEQDWADATVDKILRENGGMIPYGKNPYKEEGVKEIKYPGPEEYGKNNCGTGILIKCSTCEKDTNDFYRISFDSMFPVLTPQEVWWLCPACYEEHVVEPARKETKEGKAEEVMYPGPEEYKQFNCKKAFGYQMECYRCAEWSNVVYQSDDSANQLCPDCYYEHVVEPARKETKEEPVGEIKYPGPRQYVRIRSVSTTYTCRTCKRVGDAIWSARAMCNHEATQICHACYHEHVVGPAKEEKVKKEIEYPSKERYERMEHDEASECLTCHINTKVFYTVSNLGYKMNLPCKVRWLCVACYEEHVVKSELAPMKKVEPVVYPGPDKYDYINRDVSAECTTCLTVCREVYENAEWPAYHPNARSLCPNCFMKNVYEPAEKVEPPKAAVEYPTSDHYQMEETFSYNYSCGTCGLFGNKIHVMNYFMMDPFDPKSLYLCPDCFAANVKDPEPAPVEAYDAIKNYPLLNGIVDPF